MDLNALTAVSPVDGRYREKVESLGDFFSEFALFRYRLRVEVEYFIALSRQDLKGMIKLDEQQEEELRKVYRSFSLIDARRIKTIEKETNHDIKAVEYFIKEQFDRLGLQEGREFIHFALTSQDINNTAVPMSLRDAHHQVYKPALEQVKLQIATLAEEWQEIPMLAHTHGQPASPTTIGKELRVFLERLDKQTDYFRQIPWAAKFGGASGNLNAHRTAYPEVNWKRFADRFLRDQLRLTRSRHTTQIEHYDQLSALLDCYRRINTILIDLSRDIWTYISMDYLKLKIVATETGSSTMPHKVNPIDFENAEGNLGVANSLFRHMADKLPISRLQRDLTDSTVLRNVGVPIAHSLIALKALTKGLEKISVNRVKLESDLEANWEVIAEAVQTVLRRESYPEPYERIKDFTRNTGKIGQDEWHLFIDALEVDSDVKRELKAITPHNYTGYTTP